jgi:hypothetical protein
VVPGPEKPFETSRRPPNNATLLTPIPFDPRARLASLRRQEPERKRATDLSVFVDLGLNAMRREQVRIMQRQAREESERRRAESELTRTAADTSANLKFAPGSGENGPGENGPGESEARQLAQATPTTRSPFPNPIANAAARFQGASGGEETVADVVANDIIGGIVESPVAVLGGVRDAAQELVDFGRDFGAFKRSLLPEFLKNSFLFDPAAKPFNEFNEDRVARGLQPLSFRAFLDTRGNFPEVGEPGTTTGQVTRGTVQFLSGFGALGAIFRSIKLATRAKRAISAVARGALTDAIFFDPREERLSNFLRDHAGLRDPVTEFLASNADDSAALGRLKSAVEGAALGIPADFVVGAIRSLRSTRALRVARDTRVEMDRVWDNFIAPNRDAIFGENRTPQTIVQALGLTNPAVDFTVFRRGFGRTVAREFRRRNIPLPQELQGDIDAIGNIRVPWGRAGKIRENFAEGFGIAHIIAKRMIADGFGEAEIESLLRQTLPEILARGRIVNISSVGDSAEDIVPRVVLELDGFRAILDLVNRNVDPHRPDTFVVTAFEILDRR